MTRPSIRVPAALQEKFNTIAQAINAFCNQQLSNEQPQFIRLATDGA